MTPGGTWRMRLCRMGSGFGRWSILCVTVALLTFGAQSAQSQDLDARAPGADERQPPPTASSPFHLRGSRSDESLDLPLIGLLGGAVNAVKVALPYAYIGMGRQLVVADVSDPTRGRIVSRSEVLPGTVTDVDILDGRAYVTTEDFVNSLVGGMEVLDVADPRQPRWLGSLPLGKPATAVQAVGQRAFVTLAWSDNSIGQGALIAVNVANAAGPRELGRLDFSDGARPFELTIQDDLAYVASGTGGLQIIDVSDMARMRLLGQATLKGIAQGVQVVGHVAYVAAVDRDFNLLVGLSVFDVEDPMAPQPLSNLKGFRAHALEVVGSMAYVASDKGLQLIDVNDPMSPWLRATIGVPGAAEDVHVVDGVAYVVDGMSPGRSDMMGGLTMLDVATTGTPRLLGHVDAIKGAGAIQAVGTTVYLAEGKSSRLQVIHVGDPSRPRLRGSVILEGEIMALQVVGTMAYVGIANYESGPSGALWVVDVSRPDKPVPLGVAYTNEVASVFVQNGLAFVAAWYGGLKVFDISVASRPRLIGQLILPRVGETIAGAAADIRVVGRYAYVAVLEGGLQIIDISKPSDPRPVGGYWTAPLGSARRLRVMDGLVYLVSDNLWIIDASHPEAPTLIAKWDDGFWGGAIEASGHTVFLDRYAIDVSSPADPKSMGAYYPRGFEVNGLHAIDGRLYVADGEDGLVILAQDALPPGITPTRSVPATNTPEPRPLERHHAVYLPLLVPNTGKPQQAGLTLAGHIGGPVTAVQVLGPRAFLALGSRMGVVDVSDPTQLRLIGQSDLLSAEVKGLAVEGSRAAVLTRDGRLYLLDIDSDDNGKPTTVGELVLPGAGQAVGMAQGLIYVVCGTGWMTSGLRIIDPAISSSPRIIGGLDIDGELRDLALGDGLAFLAGGPGGLQVVDIKVPSHPMKVGDAGLLSAEVAYGSKLAISGTRVYMTTFDAVNGASGAVIIDISSPTAPRLLGRLDARQGFRILDIVATDQLAYVTETADIASRLRVMEVSIPGAVKELSTVLMPGYPVDVQLKGAMLYAAGGEVGGFQVVDVSAALSPKVVADLPRPASADQSQIVGSLAYVSDSIRGRLQIFDLSLPENPVLVGTVDTLDRTYGLRVFEQRAYEVIRTEPRQSGSLRIYDLSVPRELRLLASLTIPDFWIDALDVAEDRAYVTSNSGKLWVVDVAMPTTPRLIASLDAEAPLGAIEVRNGLAYVGEEASQDSGKFLIVDVSHAEAPRVLSRVDLWGGVTGLQIVGKLAYVTVASGRYAPAGMAIIDVTDPVAPRLTGWLQVPGARMASNVHVDGTLAYLSLTTPNASGDFLTKLMAIDVSQPGYPRIGSGSSLTIPSCYHLEWLPENHLVLTCGSNGLITARVQPPDIP